MVDLRPVAHILGFMVCGVAVIMLLPLGVEAFHPGGRIHPFFEALLASLAVGGMMVLSTRRVGRLDLSLRQAFLLTAGAWVIVPAFAALPFLGAGFSPADAYFESMSGLTTTGSTVISGLDHRPHGILLWRALLHWTGGIGIIVMAMVLLPFLRIGGMQLFHTESSERSDKLFPRQTQLAVWILLIYGGLTFACFAAYSTLGMDGFDALCHAMATLSTGGFSTHDASFGYFPQPGLHWAATIFMVAGALPFGAYIATIRSNRTALVSDPQVRLLVALLVIVTFGLSLWLALETPLSFPVALKLVAFNVTSIVTTTGFVSDDYTQWGSSVIAVFLVLTFIGGCSGSTSGAIKMYRHQVLWIIVRTHLLHLVMPNRVMVARYYGRPMPPDVPLSVLAFLAAFVGSVGAFTVVLGMCGLDLVTAFTAALTALTNVGPGLGDVIGPAGNFAGLPDSAKWALSAAMLLGRLELFTVLVLLMPSFWQA